jgi:hypothetical protein
MAPAAKLHISRGMRETRMLNNRIAGSRGAAL